MSTPTKSQGINLKFRKIMAWTYLQENRLEDAVDIIVGILQDYPNDVDALMTLGNLYLSSGNPRTARKLFQRALEVDPNRTEIRQQDELARQKPTQGLPEEPVPTDIEAIARLLNRLTHKVRRPSETEIIQAAEILKTIMTSEQPGEEIAKRLDEMDNLLPALIEINIWQARADGQHDLAEVLQNIQINIAMQKCTEGQEPQTDESLELFDTSFLPKHDFSGRVTVLVPDVQFPSARVALICRALQDSGCSLNLMETFSPENNEMPDLVIASNPHLNPDQAQSLALCSSLRIPIIVDLDCDFENLPVHHPDYAAIGLINQEISRAYTSSRLLADLITVPSAEMADSLNSAGYQAALMPDGWDRQERSWKRNTVQSSHVNIGWVEGPGQMEDLALLRRVLIRVLREYDRARIVIVGSEEAHRLFEHVPEERRLFFSPASEDEYREQLDQIDVLIAPMRKNPFNLSQSDRLLLEAGVKGIPWVASPVPAFVQWKSGGLLASTQEEWHTSLRHLVKDQELRERLGREGYRVACNREATYLSALWISTIEQVISMKLNQVPAKSFLSV
jgi:glycosyltransferase involved in cell wall biosynthesis